MAARKRPVHGVLDRENVPTIVMVTVCTKKRMPWMTTPENHVGLRETWTEAEAWLVGSYVLMPDHLHLFAAPGRLEISVDNWIKYWKSQFSKKRGLVEQEWQTDHWDTRLRSGESYDEKWSYVRNNPVRAGLVACADDWPYQGELNVLHWS